MTNNLTTTYSWNAAGQLLTTTVAGQHTAVYTYDQRGNLTLAVTNGLTTTFVYNGHNQRLQLSVNGQPTTYLLDYARGGNRVLQESNALQTKFYLYGDHCLAELVETDNPEQPEQRYYLYDGSQTVRQTVNEQAEPTYAWTFSPEGAVLLGEEGPVSHLSCVGDAVYDWSTGLIYKNGKYYDTRSDLWLTFGSPAVVWAVGRWNGSKRKDKKQEKRFFWLLFLLLVLFVLVGCQNAGTPTPGLPATMAPKPTETCTPIPTSTPESIPALPPPVMLNPTSTPTQQPTKTVSSTLTPTNTQEPLLPNGQKELAFPIPSFHLYPPLSGNYIVENRFGSTHGNQNNLGGEQGTGHDGLDLISTSQSLPVPVYSPVNGQIWDYQPSSFTITVREIKDINNKVIEGLELKITHVYKDYDIDQNGTPNELFKVWESVSPNPNKPLTYYDNLGNTGGIAHLHLGVAIYENNDYTGEKIYYNPERLLP